MEKKLFEDVCQYLNDNNIGARVILCHTRLTTANYNKYTLREGGLIPILQSHRPSSCEHPGTLTIHTLVIPDSTKPFSLKIGNKVRISWDGYHVKHEELNGHV